MANATKKVITATTVALELNQQEAEHLFKLLYTGVNANEVYGKALRNIAWALRDAGVGGTNEFWVSGLAVLKAV